MPRKPSKALSVCCAHCGIRFQTTTQRLRKAGHSHQFCGVPCFQAYRKEHSDEFPAPPIKKARAENSIEVECQQCGKAFIRQSCDLRQRSAYGPFCSHKCYGKWRSENLTGEDSPSWEGGYALDYGGSNWKRQRRHARKRDEHTCQDCGAIGQEWGHRLDVHHIVPYNMFDDPEEANQLKNLVTLCRQCHARRHSNTYELAKAG